MTKMQQIDINQRRRSLVALLSWFSATTATTPFLQHRVRRPERVLEYQHVLEDRPRGVYEKFRIPSSRGGPNRRSRRLERNPITELQTYFEDEEYVWHLSVQGGDVDDDGSTSSSKRFPQQATSTSSHVQDSSRSLYEQFIGQELEGSEGNATAANIATEITNATVNETTIFTTTEDSNSSAVPNDTDLEVEVLQPIRLRAILAESTGNGNLLTDAERLALFHDMLSPALLSWSNTLRVDPVVGNLTVDVAQLLDGETCGPGIDSGLPSIEVPLSHFEEGIADTDMVVYLGLGFVIPRVNGTNLTAANETDEESSIGDTGKGDRRQMLKRGDNPLNLGQELGAHTLVNTTEKGIDEGIDDSDLCTGDYLAAASFCSTDQFDRPTAALLHICIDEHFFEPERRNRNALTLMHELSHALGFNSLSMAHFRRIDGTPYTTRIDGDVPDTEIECTGPKSDRRQARVALPSEEILQFREVRGGVRVAEVVTPSVVQAVRNQFGCQNLTGAELESGEGLPLASEAYGCIGDHWERRLFSSDLMNPVVDDLEYSPRISTLTLAYFADSGWYQVDLSGSRVASGWGRGAGCGFATEACIGKHGEVPPPNAPFFCNEIPGPSQLSVASEVSGCTPDLSRKAVCSMGRYDLELPWEYRYFQDTYGSDVGGYDALMDYCPVYTGYDNGLCASTDTKNFMLASSVERFGERNSRCLVGNLRDSMHRTTALCLPIACVVEDRSLRVKIEREWHRCEEADQEIGSRSITIICPDPRRICPTFYCPYDCLGTGGQCDYTSGQCLCELPGPFEESEPELRACVEKEEVDTPISSGVFLRSDESDRNDPALPHPDSSLSDYYVSTERALGEGEERPLQAWMIALIWFSSAVAVSLAVLLVYVSKHLRDVSSWDPSWFYRSNDDERPTQELAGNSSRNKDKMIATILVDMRMSNNADRESLAETDEQLTESEASRGAPSETMSEYSSRPSEGFSDVDTTLDDIPEDDIHDLQECPQVIRRRKLG